MMDWNSMRILLVDANAAALDALGEVMGNLFPCAEICKAGTRYEALRLSQALADRGGRYDVICVAADLREDADSQLTQKFEDNLGTCSTLGSVICLYARKDGSPSPIFQVLFGTRDQDIEQFVLEAVYTRKIWDGISPLLRQMHGLSGWGGNGSSQRCGTHRISALMRDIKLGWPHINDELRARVRNVFDVREIEGEVLVNL